MAADDRAAFVRARRKLMLAVAALLFCFGFLLPLLGGAVRAINVFGLVIGLAVMAQVSLVGLVLSLFWFAERHNALERDFGEREG